MAKRLASTLAELAPQTIILIDANQGGATVAEFLEDFRPSSHYPSTNLALSRDNSEAEVGIAPRLPSPGKNSADFAAQSITIRHHPPVSPTLILLKLLLKVSNGGVLRTSAHIRQPTSRVIRTSSASPRCGPCAPNACHDPSGNSSLRHYYKRIGSRSDHPASESMMGRTKRG